MSDAAHCATRLVDYRPPRWLVDTIELRLDLDAERTRVRSTLRVRRNPAVSDDRLPLVLYGRDLKLLAVHIDGRELSTSEYTLAGEELSLNVPDGCEVCLENEIHPAANTAGLGLFVAGGGVLATHCEPEGFRRITYFPDRPDVLATYTVTLRAGRDRYPVLLSNGNLREQGEGSDGRHFATWHDPHPKPCYLFAVVAGDLGHLADEFETRAGRRVALRIYASRDKVSLCRHAMDSLIRAMRWDEEAYGLEYDLDCYQIAALDRHVGAQENKGLNVFDAQTIVADPDVATDEDYMLIERIVGHEYFHNWTGNRVTCRDWFQLSLKEGLTRFRDQEFSRAMSAAAEKRVEAVRRLRSDQFAEDSGPGAHPVQPDVYIEVANFYTATVYEKGAEVIRMLRTLLGEEAFLRGVALYLARHDGAAATTEDFVRAIEEAAGRDLTQFRLWYRQAGTPELRLEGSYDAKGKAYRLTVSQSCPPTRDQPRKEPMHIPLAIGFLDGQGRELPVQLRGTAPAQARSTKVLEVRHATESFEFVNVPTAPVLSVLRDFSAPVRVHLKRTDREAAFLMTRDTDAVSRWDNAQDLATRLISQLAADFRAGRPLRLDPVLHDAWERVLRAESDPGFAALLLALPDESVLGAAMTPPVDLDAIVVAREFVARELAASLRDDWLSTYQRLSSEGPYRADSGSIGRRRLRNLSLQYLAALGERGPIDLVVEQLHRGSNATDRLAALTILANTDCPERLAELDRFYERWRGNDLIVNKWLNAQSTSRLVGTVERVRSLMGHESFELSNPAKGLALIGGFCRRNYVQFHEPAGAGYRLFADVTLEADQLKPESIHWLMPQAMQWRRYDAVRQGLMQAQLERMLATPRISRGLYELLVKALRE